MPTTLGDPAENERALRNLNLAQFITNKQAERKADGVSSVAPSSVNQNLTYMAEQLAKPDTTKTTKVESGFGTRNSGPLTKDSSATRSWSKRTEESSETPSEKWYANGKKATVRKPKNVNKRGKK
jgi:hypothetical protein